MNTTTALWGKLSIALVAMLVIGGLALHGDLAGADVVDFGKWIVGSLIVGVGVGGAGGSIARAIGAQVAGATVLSTVVNNTGGDDGGGTTTTTTAALERVSPKPAIAPPATKPTSVPRAPLAIAALLALFACTTSPAIAPPSTSASASSSSSSARPCPKLPAGTVSP